jgi:hypothetical protein
MKRLIMKRAHQSLNSSKLAWSMLRCTKCTHLEIEMKSKVSETKKYLDSRLRVRV